MSDSGHVFARDSAYAAEPDTNQLEVCHGTVKGHTEAQCRSHKCVLHRGEKSSFRDVKYLGDVLAREGVVGSTAGRDISIPESQTMGTGWYKALTSDKEK